MVNGYLHPIYQSAYTTLGFLKDDRKWISYFNKALQFLSKKTLRILFISILTHGSVSHLA